MMNEHGAIDFTSFKKPCIQRLQVLNKVKPYIDKDVIKVFTGQRRVGKSYMLFQLSDLILERNPDAHFIYINKELAVFDFIQNHSELVDFVKRQKKEENNYLFIDEVQDIDGFEKALRSLLAGGGMDIYCTGSNANLLSGDIAGYLSGRSIEIRVFSLSYSEFLQFHHLPDSPASFLNYVRFGGLPYLIHLPLEDYIVEDYLRNIYATILYKDVVNRYGIRNTYFLEQLVKFCADNTGQLFSAKRISDFLKSQKVNISVQGVLNYMDHLVNSFMIHKVSRQAIAGRKIFETGEKYYFEDIGLRNAVIGFKQADIAKLLENIVYLHLVMSGYQVTVGSLGDYEIDFVAERAGSRIYVQVAYLMAMPETIEREVGNLLKVKDNFPKYIVTMDELPASSSEGILQLNIRDFLLQQPAI